MGKDFGETEYDVQEEVGRKLRYDYSANLQVKEVSIIDTSVGVAARIKLFMASRPKTMERLVMKDYNIEVDGVKSLLTIEVRKDIAIDDYFSIHQLKEMNFDIANIVASKLGATTQPVRCDKDDD